MPYKKVGYVKNASIDAMVNMEIEDGKVSVCVYTTGEEKDVSVYLEKSGEKVFCDTTDISPVKIYEKEIPVSAEKKTDLTVRVVNAQGKELVSFTPLEEKIPELPKPAEAAKDPEEILTCEELYLTGQHIEQYRHATYLPDPYYLEGLKRDEGDIRLNTAYGMLLFRRGQLKESEKYFRRALKRMTWKNPNPYNSEAYYDLGLTLFYQERYDEAYDAFFKATWTNEQQEMSFYFLAAIASIKKEYRLALELIEKGLVKNSHNIKARGLKAAILRKLGETEKAEKWIAESLQIDCFDYVSSYEEILLADPDEKENKKEYLKAQMRNFHQNFIQAAIDYMEGGFYQEALEILNICDAQWPMLYYYRGAALKKMGDIEAAKEMFCLADKADPYCCFPNRLEDIHVLQMAAEVTPQCPKAYYYLGNIWYDKRQYQEAQENWEKAAGLDPEYPTTLRNLALVYYNKVNDPSRARLVLEKAFALDPSDARVFLELDQLYKKLKMSAEDRLAFYEKHKETFVKRDDLFIEYITLKNFTGEYETAYELLMGRKFHPWEGGEGKATTQYTTALVGMAKKALVEEKYETSEELLEKALVYPENLGEGKLEGTKDNHINYYLALVKEALGKKECAEQLLEQAVVGTDEPAGMMFYYDQPADMIMYQGFALEKLHKSTPSKSRFQKLISYGEAHIYDEVKMDYFAVSYPDLQIFEEDLTQKNKAHCYYLMGLGNLGLKNMEKAAYYFGETLKLDPHHLNARIYLRDAKERLL